MADARLPSHWLNSMQFDVLSEVAWRVFTGALMWSVNNGTDGLVPKKYLRMLHHDGEQPEAYEELIRAGLWSRSGDGYQMHDWNGAMGQSTAEEVETYKANGRMRAKNYRERTREKLAARVGFVSITDTTVTGDVRPNVRPNVGKGNGNGNGRDMEAPELQESVNVNLQTGEVEDPASTWHVASISGSSGSESTSTARETDSTPLDSDEATVTTAVSAEWEHVDGRTRRVRKSA